MNTILIFIIYVISLNQIIDLIKKENKNIVTFLWFLCLVLSVYFIWVIYWIKDF